MITKMIFSVLTAIALVTLIAIVYLLFFRIGEGCWPWKYDGRSHHADET